MPAINSVIIEKLEEMVRSDSNIPSEVEELIMSLLSIESIAGRSTEGITKLYDQVLQKYINDSKVIQWSSGYED